MSNTVTVHGQFQDGMASDIYAAGSGEFSVAKHFDTLTYPGRLHPLRGVTADTVNTSIGNIILASDGLMYGVGVDYPGNPTRGKLWQRSGYGNSDVWQSVPTNSQLSGAVIRGFTGGYANSPDPLDYALLVEYKDAGNAKQIFWASTNLLVASDRLGASTVTTQALTFTTIGQGFVHPKDKILYIPYQTATSTYVGTISPDATPFNTRNLTALQLPSQYRIPCLTNYGNYLAIPGYATDGSSVSSSIVYLWDRDTTLNTLSESINWGQGQLQVLNNLNGALIGISVSSMGTTGGNTDQDSVSLIIKEYSGGTEPVLIKELIAQHYAGSSHPTITLNPNVNFIYKNRMYFSANINPNDGLSSSYYGLWSVGKNKINGRYTVNLERMGANDGSDTGLIACAMKGDFVSMCHSSVGNLVYTINGLTSSSTYGATSVYESAVNPMMGTNRYTRLHPLMQKQLLTFAVHCLPLTSGQQIVGKFRVDSQSSADWVTAFTKTSASPAVSPAQLTVHEQVKDANGNNFTPGRNFEFRLESTGGAVITGYTYSYSTLKTNLGEKL